MSDTSKLVNGGLYLIRWIEHPMSSALGLFRTNRDECDMDETPREEWQFFGTDLTADVSEYEAITRLDVVPVDWLNTEAGTWPE